MEPSDFKATWRHSGVPGNSAEAMEATGHPKFLSTPGHQNQAIEMRIGGQRPLSIEVQRSCGEIHTFKYNGPGSVIRVENVVSGNDISYVHLSNCYGRVSSNVSILLGSSW